MLFITPLEGMGVWTPYKYGCRTPYEYGCRRSDPYRSQPRHFKICLSPAAGTHFWFSPVCDSPSRGERADMRMSLWCDPLGHSDYMGEAAR